MRNLLRPLHNIRALLAILAMAGFAWPSSSSARLLNADPTNYRARVAALVAGDTLLLAAGAYLRLTVDGRNGTTDAWIVIRGTGTPSQTVIQGEPLANTVQLYGSSYLALENLRIDGRGYDVDGVNAKGTISHDIRIEGCTLVGLGNNQSTIGISTKVTVWNWIIRNNTILEAGTGLYLGNSDGTAPFVNGVIEGNYVENPTGYCMEIKHQVPYTAPPGMPAGPNRTIIRNNVFRKDDRPMEFIRPNLLVGPFPTSGPGASDVYEIYGNFLYHNPIESLFQGSGRMTIHDNVLVSPGAEGAAIYLTDHNGALSYATVYNNTIYDAANGILFATPPRQYGMAVGNVIFAASPVVKCGSCTAVETRDNVTASSANAGQYVVRPSTTLGAMDFYPRADCVPCSGTALDLSRASSDTDLGFDFNGTSKGSFTFRGAYAGSGTNPGWALDGAPKIGGPSSGGTLADGVPPSAVEDLRVR